MLDKYRRGRVRLHGARQGRVGVLATALALALMPSPAALAAPPLVHDCRSDLGGANDVGGDLDLTNHCVVAGDGAPYELSTTVGLDPAKMDGRAVLQVCSLFNTDNDAFADLAACTAIRRDGGRNGNALVLDSLQLFTCSDGAADRCTGATPVEAPPVTECVVIQDKLDPFPGPSPGPGLHYPEDTVIHCDLDLDDFGAAAASPLDACSYDTEDPGSASVDCLVFRTCAEAADCDDASPCTTDSCDASGVCRHQANPGADCTDELFCNGGETCSALGFCSAADEALDCDDGVDCTTDGCDEIEDTCFHQPKNSVCSDGLFCNGVEICDPGSGCGPGAPVACRDGVSCTADTCNEDSDGCDFTPEDDDCRVILSRLAELR